MKQILTSLIIASCACAATAAESAQPDTVMVINNPSSAVITESASGLKVTITDLNSEKQSETVFVQNYPPNSSVKSSQWTARWNETTFNDGVIGVKVRKSKNHDWSFVTGGIGIGLVNAAGQPSSLGLQWAKSFEISWINAFAVRYKINNYMNVSLGIGFDWRNYKITTSNHRLCLNGLGGIGIAPYPDGATEVSSRIKVFSLGIPLLYTAKIPRTTLSVTLGGILNFNTHASLKTWYKNADGNHCEEYATDFHPRRVTADLFGSLNLYKGCGIYVRYSPCDVLQGHASPSFKPLSVGVLFFL